MNICSVDDCGSRAIAKGLCGKHYQRQLRTGATESRPHVVEELCRCGLRFARHKSANGKPLDRPLCDACYRKVQRELVEPTRFVCARCGSEFTSRFNKSHRTRYCSRECKSQAYVEDGRHAEAANRSYYKRRYGLTPEQATELRASATCEICGAAPIANGRWGNLHIDHDHTTGKVRGVLCSECNNGLGKFKDNPALLQKAIDYLARSGALIL